MHAIPSSFRAAPARQAGLIVAAILAAAALAAGAMLLAPQRPSGTSSAGAAGAIAATVPLGIAGDSAVSGDPSVPSAASVFKDKSALRRSRSLPFERRGGNRGVAPPRGARITAVTAMAKKSHHVSETPATALPQRRSGVDLHRARLRLRRAWRHGRIGAPARRRRACGGQDAGDAGRVGAAADRADARRPQGVTKNLARAIGVQVGRALRAGGGQAAQRLPGRRHLALRHEKADAGLCRADASWRCRGSTSTAAGAATWSASRPPVLRATLRRAAGALRHHLAESTHAGPSASPMKSLFPLLAALAGLPDRLAVVRRDRQPDDGPGRSAHLRLGNPGATNVLRSGSKKAAIATLLLDAPEGLVPVLAAAWWGKRLGLERAAPVGAGRPRRLPRPPLAGVLPLQGRQGRGHRGRRAAGDQSAGWAWRRWPPG